jgi:2-succinyl-6-hydroxy-2,4-cyclohexadiene-1-carboxylate synthase
MAAPTIVLLHGFTQTGRSWDATIAALAERYRAPAGDPSRESTPAARPAGCAGEPEAAGMPRAIAPDLRGHGAAAGLRPVSFEAVRADVLALAPERCALAGYSMGGRIALDLALSPEARDRIERLVLIGASPGLADAEERRARRAADEALAERIERHGIEAFARGWAALPLLAEQPPEVAAAAHAMRLAQAPAGLAAALRGLGTGVMTPLWDRLGELAMPVDLVVGERDAKVRAIAERMAGLIPRATLDVVPGAGHAVQLEAPAAVAAILGRR